jgi:hypothetical protein
MRGPEIVALRERMGLSRGELADLINSALGMRTRPDAVARWEDGRRNPSPGASAFLDELELRSNLEAFGGAQEPAGDDPPLRPDSAPGDPHGPLSDPESGFEQQALALSGSPLLVKACTELVEMVAMVVGSVGALVGSPALELDGSIIHEDRQALGEAWGRFAETNETFRRMLTSTLAGGAWLQVALVTGTTVSKCYHGHVELRLAKQREAALYGDPLGEQSGADEPLAA